MTPGVRPLVAGNWKMNGLSGSLAEIDAMRRAADAGESGVGRTPRLPAGDAARASRLEDQGRRAQPRRAGLLHRGERRFHRRHFRRDAQRRGRELTSSWGIPSVGPIITKPTSLSAPRRKPRLRPASLRSSASARPMLSAKPASRPLWLFGNCEGRCLPKRAARRSWSPTSRSGRSAPGSRPRPRTSPASTMEFGRCSPTCLGRRCAKIRLLYGGSVKPTNCDQLLTLDNVDGALVGGASLKATEFLAIAAALSLTAGAPFRWTPPLRHVRSAPSFEDAGPWARRPAARDLHAIRSHRHSYPDRRRADRGRPPAALRGGRARDGRGNRQLHDRPGPGERALAGDGRPAPCSSPPRF